MSKARSIAAVLWLLTAVAPAAAQDSLEEKLQKKLKEPFLGKAAWITDYEKAREESRKTGKPIFAYFTRSFLACDACAKVEGGPFLKAEFAKFAEKFVLYCNITSHVAGAKDQGLMAEKGWAGSFPYLVFLDAEGAVLLRQEGEPTVERLQETGARVLGYFDLKAKAEKGTPAVKIDFILAQLEFGRLKPAEAEVKIRETGGRPSEAQEKRFDGLVADAEVEAAVRALKRDDPKGKLVTARKFYERYKAGKAAPTADFWMTAYWNLILEYSESVQDVATFELSLGILKAKHGQLPEAKRYFEEKEATLKKLKEARK